LAAAAAEFLLSEPATALSIVRAVVESVGGRRPVTLKMRRGFDDSAESEQSFFTILDGAFALGAAAVTVHGRTVKQRYIGPSNWNFLARVKRHAGSRTILGSGDLFAAPLVRRMIDETGVDGVTIARGAIGNPFIFRECGALLNGKALSPHRSERRWRAGRVVLPGRSKIRATPSLCGIRGRSGARARPAEEGRSPPHNLSGPQVEMTYDQSIQRPKFPATAERRRRLSNGTNAFESLREHF
jgi:tRNA-dihydrouridine synthase